MSNILKIFTYLFGGAVEYFGPVNLDINLISLQSLKRNTGYVFLHVHIKILDAHVK